MKLKKVAFFSLYITKIESIHYIDNTIKTTNPKKSRGYLNLALSYAKNTFPEFKEGYEETIYKKLQELG